MRKLLLMIGGSTGLDFKTITILSIINYNKKTLIRHANYLLFSTSKNFFLSPPTFPDGVHLNSL